VSTKEAVLGGLFAGVAFALGMALLMSGGTFWSATHGGDPARLLAKAAGPLASGVVFGSLIGIVLARVGKQLSIPEGELPEWFRAEEVLLRQGPANHWRGPMNYGGWLYLTNARLRFVPHRMLQAQEAQEWPLEEITAAELVRTLLLVPNGLAIRLAEGADQRFVVRLSERDGWRNSIDDARAAVQIGPPPEPSG